MSDRVNYEKPCIIERPECHARKVKCYEGTNFERWAYTCGNTGATYGMLYCPRYCPECGGQIAAREGMSEHA